MKEEILGYLDDVIADQVEGHTEPGEPITDDALGLIGAELEMLLVTPVPTKGLAEEELTPEDVMEHFGKPAREAYERRENDWGEELTREVERRVMLSIIDEKWRDHLYEMDMLKEGIGLRAWGQKDPLLEYKREAFNAFEAMMGSLGEDVIRRFFRVSIVQPPAGEAAAVPMGAPVRSPTATEERHAAFSSFDEARAGAATSAPPQPRSPVRTEKKVGRNDPCPCGSGKKYKKCHGA
jgi:preprotein translocase subunit SecA